MRRSSSTSKRCGALSGGGLRGLGIELVSLSFRRFVVGAREQPFHFRARGGIDHGCEKPARRLTGAGAAFMERTCKAARLQECKVAREGFPLRCEEKKALPAVGGTGLLNH